MDEQTEDIIEQPNGIITLEDGSILEPSRDVVPTTTPIICQLTAAEIGERGIELAKLTAARNTALSEAQAYAKAAATRKKEADVLSEKCSKLSEVITTGQETRQELCYWYDNVPSLGIRSLLHPKTQEVLASQPMPMTEEAEVEPNCAMPEAEAVTPEE